MCSFTKAHPECRSLSAGCTIEASDHCHSATWAPELRWLPELRSMLCSISKRSRFITLRTFASAQHASGKAWYVMICRKHTCHVLDD